MQPATGWDKPHYNQQFPNKQTENKIHTNAHNWKIPLKFTSVL